MNMTLEKGIAIATRIDENYYKVIRKDLPSNIMCSYNRKARMVIMKSSEYQSEMKNGKVGLISAGIHLLFSPLKKMLQNKVSCIIVVAGMEGALPTLVKGLVDVPVIGVPTSIGYGYGGNGTSALISMLQSCSPGLVVVNIDNGFGAACAASLIAIQQQKGNK